MSERGIFATSFVYDNRLEVIKPLCAYLKSFAREGTFAATEHTFFGVMHGGYPGEEAHMIEFSIDELVKELPEKHGRIEFAVLPESAEHAIVYSIHDREVTSYRASGDEWRTKYEQMTEHTIAYEGHGIRWNECHDDGWFYTAECVREKIRRAQCEVMFLKGKIAGLEARLADKEVVDEAVQGHADVPVVPGDHPADRGDVPGS